MAFRKILLYGSAGVVGIYGSALAYVKSTLGVCQSDRDLEGKTVIVTGANTGIGLETARDLARRNARVVLACRTQSRGEEAARDIVESTGNTNVVVKQLDVSSFQSVREFARDILKTEKRLDVLVNNAGVVVWLPKGQKSADGLELTMATNHFGPFLLTNLLLPLMKESKPSRIVVVSSMAYERGKCEDLEKQDEDKCSRRPIALYRQTKLANVLFTRELAERLRDTGVTVNALHPGVVKTELNRGMNKNFISAVYFLFGPLMKSPQEGAQTSIYVSVAEELEGVSGKYFSDCKEKALKKHALDEKAAKRLWEYSEEVTKIGTASK